MSLVFPAGKGRQITWLDRLNGKEEEEVKGQTKTASTKKTAKVAETRELIGTAAISMDELKRLAQLSDFPQEDVQVEDALSAPVGEEPVAPEGEVAVSDEAEGGEAEGGAEDVAEDAAEAGNPVEQAADAVADAQDALADAAEALADAGADEGGKDSAISDEGAIGDDAALGDEEIEIPVDIDGAGNIGLECDKMEKSDSAPAVAPSAPPKGAAMASEQKSEKKQATTAAVEDSARFVKIAKLSPVNRQKLATYWIKTLGYDKDWVNQMLQDYN